jgi:hypothetical protein
VALAFKRARLKMVYNILRGKDLDTGVFSEDRRAAQFERLKAAQVQVLHLAHWHEFLKALLLAGYRAENMISSENALLLSYAWYLIARTEYGLDIQRAKSLIARWFFMVSLTGRYTGSFEAAMEEDLARIRGVDDAAGFATAIEGMIAAALPNDFWDVTLPAQLETAAARSPAAYAYYASLNVLGAKVLFSDQLVSSLLDPSVSGPRAALERHHLFPRQYLKKVVGIASDRHINQAANFTLLEWADNGEIADQPPATYVPAFQERFEQQYGPEAVRRVLMEHALPERWYEMPYEEFLQARRPLMAQVIRRGYEALA